MKQTMKDRLLKESDVMEAINKRVEELLNDPVFVRKKGYIDVLGVKKYILAIPSADRPQGEWEEIPYKRQGHEEVIIDGTSWRCTNCGNAEKRNEPNMNFCPNCGADMRGVDND